MDSPKSRIQVAVVDGTACAVVTGRACFGCSPDFKRLMYGLKDRGVRSFALELTQCTIMDSTFLGILAGFARALGDRKPGDADGLVLWNPSQRILELLDNLGVTQLFSVRHGQVSFNGELQEVEPAPANKRLATETALEAHKELMAINPANVAKFKDVAAFMAEDLKRLEVTPPSA